MCEHAWEKIAAWFCAHVPRTSLRPGVSEVDLRVAESTMKLHFPEDVRESYFVHDGAENGAFFLNFRLMSLADIVENWKGFESILEVYETLGQLDYNSAASEPEGPVKRLMFNTRWIPIMDTGAGDTVYVDLDPPPGGAVGQVFESSHEIGPLRVLGPSFGEWLSQYATDLEAGKYRFDDFSGNIIPFHP